MEFIGIILILALYFLPSIIGYSHRNFGSIFLLNLLLGWTVIGWIVAIIWAVSNDKKETIIVNNDKKSVSDKLKELKELHDDGTLTKEEFEAEKKHILRG
ncbi:superinfection immunity protein [Flavobacterium sp. XS1P32]|uniref:superinfection immunity protein n=1 Tax=unclassified Flavobacterium TaxID=196869 RepID=UPI003AAEF904